VQEGDLPTSGVGLPIIMDLDTIRQFKKILERIYPEQGWAFFAFGKDDRFGQSPFYYPSGLQEALDKAVQYNKWANVWFCPHLFDDNSRKKPNALPDVWAAWVDKDLGNLHELQPKPTVCWTTSELKYQALWILKEPTTPQIIEQVNKHLTATTGSDSGGWALTKLLRIPGSMNYKYVPEQQGELLWDDGPEYYAEELLPIDPEDKPDRPMTVDEIKETLHKNMSDSDNTRSMPKKWPDYAKTLNKWGKSFPPSLWDLLNTRPGKDDDWSKNLWNLECMLLETGMKIHEAFVIAKHSPWNKYERDKRGDHGLWVEIQKVESRIFQNKVVEDEENSLPWQGINSLMMHSKRPEWMVKDIWMDENVGWIAGVGKSYKSVISLDLALSIASGKPFLGEFEVQRPGGVLMIQEEDPLWRVAHRVQVLAAQKGITTSKVNKKQTGVDIVVGPNKTIPLYISVAGGVNFSDQRKLELVEKGIAEHRPRMVILDPMFMMSIGIDEFKSSEITYILDILKHWRNVYGCSIAVVHHYRKSNGENNEKLYGNMALYAWSENSLFINRTKDDNTVEVHRDIKDAPTDESFKVKFNDIDAEYSFEIDGRTHNQFTSEKYAATIHDDQMPETQQEIERLTSLDKFLLYCKKVGPGNQITTKEVTSQVGVSRRTLINILTEAEELGYITKLRMGNSLVIEPEDSILNYRPKTAGKEMNLFDD